MATNIADVICSITCSVIAGFKRGINVTVSAVVERTITLAVHSGTIKAAHVALLTFILYSVAAEIYGGRRR